MLQMFCLGRGRDGNAEPSADMAVEVGDDV